MEQQQQPTPASQPLPGRQEGQRANVLCIDPALPLHQQITQELSAFYEVRHAMTAGEALASMKRRTPDLIITEIDLPDMSGFALCERLRADPVTQRLPIMFLTRRDSILDKVTGFQAGVDDYLVKPIDPRFFSARVRLLFRIKSLEQKHPPGG